MGRLSGRYAIVGVGESRYSRKSGQTPVTLGVEAIRNAILDAGLSPKEIDSMYQYSDYDIPDAMDVLAHAESLGTHLKAFIDTLGGGSAIETQIATAIASLEAGICQAAAVFRNLDGYSYVRLGHTGARAEYPIMGTLNAAGMTQSQPIERPYGYQTPMQRIAMAAMAHMKEYGTTNSQLAAVKVAHSRHASNNPKAIYKKRVTVEDVLNSRWIVKPLHLLDCCVETDGAAALIITSADRAWSLRRPPVYILGVAARVFKDRADYPFARRRVISLGQEEASRIAFGMAGISIEDVDFTAASDTATWTTLALLEEAGYCKRGEGGDYVSSGAIELGGARPNNTSGGHLCEAYTDGMGLVVEAVRQLRWQADDYCPGWEQGIHSYDYSEGKCRQVKEPHIAHVMGWTDVGVSSSLILSREARV